MFFNAPSRSLVKISSGNLIILTAAFLAIVALAPTPALGGEGVYQPLVGIPGLDNPAENFGAYLNQLYFLSISIAALIAVVKIIIAGVKWMMTDLISGKSEAAGEIRASLLGLLLIVSAVLILETINPQLTNFNVLRFATPARVPTINPVEQDRRERTTASPEGGATMQGRSVADMLQRPEFASHSEEARQNVRAILESFAQPGVTFSEESFLSLSRSASDATGKVAEQILQSHNLERLALGRTPACQGRGTRTVVSGEGPQLTLSATCAP